MKVNDDLDKAVKSLKKILETKSENEMERMISKGLEKNFTIEEGS